MFDSWVMATALYSSKIGMETTWSLLRHIRKLYRICNSYIEANACVDALVNTLQEFPYLLTNSKLHYRGI